MASTSTRRPVAESGRGECSVKDVIEQSKRHWSQLSHPGSEFVEEGAAVEMDTVRVLRPPSSSPQRFHFFRMLAACFGFIPLLAACFRSAAAPLENSGPCCDEDGDGAAEIDNWEVFKSLQLHPTCGDFFCTFGYDFGRWRSGGELVVAEKFAEGAQAELFHAHVVWMDPKMNEQDEEMGYEWVLKVFKKGTLLRDLQSQWPHGFLQFYVEEAERKKLGKPGSIRFNSEVIHGTLLRDGRFAFLIRRENEDLRSVIDRMMKSKTSRSSGPFSKVITEEIMWLVAKGMDWLHSRNIVHRDLKASNVLVGKDEKSILVADFECSVGVVGTGFFRAPEILQACKDKTINHRPELFTKAVDVYSYGMTCYEILTGKLPFEGHLQNDYDLVLSGCRPEVPKYVDGWILELLSSCWQADPIARPSFAEILNLLISSSTIARKINKASIESEEERLRLFQVKLSKRNSQFLGFLL